MAFKRKLSEAFFFIFFLFGTALEFIEESDAELSRKLAESKNSIAYLTDIFREYNSINKKLQGNELNLIRTKKVIKQFMIQLQVMRLKLRAGKICNFPCLSAENKEKRTSDAELKVFCDHLVRLHADMSTRFEDIIKLDIPSWVAQPFVTTINLSEMESITDVEEELLTVQTDFEPCFLNPNNTFGCKRKLQLNIQYCGKKLRSS